MESMKIEGNSMIKLLPRQLIAWGTACATILGMASLPAAASAAATTITATNAVNVSDGNATSQTRALFKKLADTTAGGLRFGQQHATDEAISPTAANGDVYEMTGKYPAVMGWDAGLGLTGEEKPGASGASQDANAQALAKDIAAANKEGAIVTLSAHWHNPATNGAYNDTTKVADEILPGGKYSKTFTSYLDGIAKVAQSSKDAQGNLIPIIFRPLHENNGNWFWWGATHASTTEYIELYRYIVNYLRDVKGVHNLLYAYSPGGTFNGDPADYLATYPGDDYVDVLGYDYYDSTSTGSDSSTWISTAVKDMAMIGNLAQNSGKVSAFTEFGQTNGRKITETANANPEFFSQLAQAIAKGAPKTAYMMTWANFGGSGDSFQAYTPWKGSIGEPAFKEFATSSANLWASSGNVDYTATTTATPRKATARIVTPVAGERVTTSTLTVRVKADNIPANELNTRSAFVSLDRKDAQGHAITIALSWHCNGYFEGSTDLSKDGIALDNTKLTLTPTVSTITGAVLPSPDASNAVTVTLGQKPATPANEIDSFDNYDSMADFDAVYSTNNTSSSNASLVASPEAGGKQAFNFHYDFNAYPGYNGFTRSYSPTMNWSGFNNMNLFLDSDGSGQKLVIQFQAGGVTFEAYPSLADKGGKTVTLSFGDADGNGSDFHPASWDTANAAKKTSQKLLSQISGFAIYINDNSTSTQAYPKTGDIQLDSIMLGGTRDPYDPGKTPTAPVTTDTVDDFESYATDADLQSAWNGGGRGHTENLSLTTGDNSKQAMQFKADFATAKTTWIDVSKSLGSADWTGMDTITLDVNGDGSNNAMAIQLGSNTGTYFLYQLKLDFTGWKTVSIPISEFKQSWPDPKDPSNPATPGAADLASMKEFVIAASRWSGDSIDFAVDNIAVTQSVKPITVDDFESYASDADVQSAWGNRKNTQYLSLATGDNSKQAMQFKADFATAETQWIDTAKYLGSADWTGMDSVTLDVNGDNSGNAMSLQLGSNTAGGTYFEHDVKLDFTGWKTISIPISEFTQTWPKVTGDAPAPAAADLASMKEFVIAANQWNTADNSIDFAVDNITLTGSNSSSEGSGDSGDTGSGTPADNTLPANVLDIAAMDPATCPITATTQPGGGTSGTTAADKGGAQSSLADTGSSAAAIALLATLLTVISAIGIMLARMHSWKGGNR
jgi:mannan endo-1,4-beta-mannosidase